MIFNLSKNGNCVIFRGPWPETSIDIILVATKSTNNFLVIFLYLEKHYAYIHVLRPLDILKRYFFCKYVSRPSNRIIVCTDHFFRRHQ